MEAKKLSALIKTIGANSAKAREQIQQALIGCAEHVFAHGDSRPCNELFEAVGQGTRQEGMLKWLVKYAPVYFKKGAVVVSTERRKVMVETMTVEQYAAELVSSKLWHAIPKEQDIKSPADWDSAKFGDMLATYLEKASKKAEGANDTRLAVSIRDPAMVLRNKLNDDMYLVKESVEVIADGKAVDEDEASKLMTECIKVAMAGVAV